MTEQAMPKFKSVPEDVGTVIYPDRAEKNEYTLKASQRYRDKWRNEHKTRMSLRFAYETESDAISKLESVPDKTDYIRKLIQKDLG